MKDFPSSRSHYGGVVIVALLVRGFESLEPVDEPGQKPFTCEEKDVTGFQLPLGHLSPLNAGEIPLPHSYSRAGAAAGLPG